MVPSVGRIVHFVDRRREEGEKLSCRAALVTEVDPDSIALTVFTPAGTYVARSTHDEDEKPVGTWHEPERVS